MALEFTIMTVRRRVDMQDFVKVLQNQKKHEEVNGATKTDKQQLMNFGSIYCFYFNLHARQTVIDEVWKYIPFLL